MSITIANFFSNFAEIYGPIFSERIPPLLIQHIQLVFLATGIAILIGVPLGIFLTRPALRKHSQKVLNFVNIGQAVPGLALIAIFLPILGIGYIPAVVALVIYGLLPIVRNTIAGLEAVDDKIKEAARGMGMYNNQVLWQIEFPLAFPVIMAGIKTSAVITVGTATLAALIGGGGLGRLIFTGISLFRPEFILAGSGTAAVLAIIMEKGLSYFERVVVKERMPLDF